MSQPAVNINEQDGALGTLPSGDKYHAAVGYSVGGTVAVNTPGAYARSRDIINGFGAGPLVEYGCHYVETYQRPIVLVRTAGSVAGNKGTLVISGVTGTSVITSTGTPNDDYELAWKVITGGTIGVAGITYQWSLDGGRNWSLVTALGTANTFAFPGAGGLGLAFAAGTLIAGDNVTARTTAPTWNSADLAAGLTPLGNTAIAWREVHVVGPIDATTFDTIETFMSGQSTAHKPRAWVGNTRVPNVGEDEATYLAAMNTIFSTKATVYGDLCSGAEKLTASGNYPGRKYKRPVSWSVAARSGAVSEEVNIADPNLGSLPGVAIRDVNGNVDEHDESINPGLDDARFTVLRTFPGRAGIYVNRPRLFSAAGSDFFLVPHRLVMNLAREAAYSYLVGRLNKPVLVNATTGKILEAERLEIENGLDAAIRAVLMAKPKASGGGYPQGKFCLVSADDNLLSTRTLTVDGRIIPLAYIETINFSLGFYNPALQVQPV